MDNHEAIASLKTLCHTCELFPRCAYEKPECFQAIEMAISALQAQDATDTNVGDMVSRQNAIDAIVNTVSEIGLHDNSEVARYGATFRQHEIIDIIEGMPSAQPERKWISCSNPPKHHKDVIVRGIEAIGNVTVHKVMQWDVDTWRPTDYAPSVMWKEWSEI